MILGSPALVTGSSWGAVRKLLEIISQVTHDIIVTWCPVIGVDG